MSRSTTRIAGAALCAALGLSGVLAVRGYAAGTPAHHLEAETLVAAIQPANNVYDDDSVVLWPDPGVTPSNRTVCSQFASRLLQHTYGYTESDFYRCIGSKSPYAKTYHDWFLGPQTCKSKLSHKHLHFVTLGRVIDWQPGDFIAIKNITVESSSTGHVAMVSTAPVYKSTANGLKKYEVLVTDSTSSPHGNADTRKTRPDTNGPDNGVGSGKMVVYAHATTGQVVGHCWSTLSGSTYYTQAQKSLVVGRPVTP